MALRKRKKSRECRVDRGPTERQRHGTYVEFATSQAGVVGLKNVTVDPISTYHRRGLISDQQWQAADYFAARFRQAQLAASYASMRFDGLPMDIIGEADQHALDVRQAAKQHVRAAFEFLGYPLAKIVEHVVGDCRTAGSWSGVCASRRPEQDGMAALRLALDGLRTYYRL